MAGFQIETGTAHGRGFVGTDATGICSLFYTWITKAYAAGGPLWYIHDDFSANAAKTCAYTDVNTTNETVTLTGHGFSTGHEVQVSTSGGLPSGLSAGTSYYIIRVDADTIKLADNHAYAMAGTAINLGSQGTGNHTVTPYEFFIVVTDTDTPVLNDYNTGPSGTAPKFLKVGYRVSEAGYIRVYTYLWWDNTDKRGEGLVAGYRIATYDDADYAYDFRGGAEQMNILARLGTAWTFARIDDFTGDTNFLEAATKVGVLQSGITAGSSEVLQLDTGQAGNFTQDKYYYIFDLDGHTWVNYIKCTNVDLVNDQITADVLSWNFPTGAVVSSYAHRYYIHGVGNGSSTTKENICVFNTVLPYYSGGSGYIIHDQTRGPYLLYGMASFDFMYNILTRSDPDDLGYFACQKNSLCEKYRPNDSQSTETSMNRCYGVTKNLYATSLGTMAVMLDYRTISATDWLYLVVDYYYSTTIALLISNTEAAS